MATCPRPSESCSGACPSPHPHTPVPPLPCHRPISMTSSNTSPHPYIPALPLHPEVNSLMWHPAAGGHEEETGDRWCSALGSHSAGHCALTLGQPPPGTAQPCPDLVRSSHACVKWLDLIELIDGQHRHWYCWTEWRNWFTVWVDFVELTLMNCWTERMSLHLDDRSGRSYNTPGTLLYPLFLFSL